MWSQPTDSSARAISESRPCPYSVGAISVSRPPIFCRSDLRIATSYPLMSERPPGRDPPNTIRTFGVSYHLNRRFTRITPTQKSVTSGNPPSKQF